MSLFHAILTFLLKIARNKVRIARNELWTAVIYCKPQISAVNSTELEPETFL